MTTSDEPRRDGFAFFRQTQQKVFAFFRQTRRDGFAFFRPGELTLLLEPTDDVDPQEGEIPALRAEDLDPLRKALGGLRGKITFEGDDPFYRNPFEGAHGDRTAVPMPWGRRKLSVLQTVSLASWRADLGRVHQPDRFARAIRDVARVVTELNQAVRKIPALGAYRLKSVAPNWLGMPFQDP